MANNIIELLRWRYATKKFDVTKKVNETELNELLESLRLTPTSYGLQPLKFIVVTNKELREKLKSASWNQSQITDASHLIVICARTDVDEKYAKEYIKLIAHTRKVPVESLKGFEDILVGFIKNMSKEQLIDCFS